MRPRYDDVDYPGPISRELFTYECQKCGRLTLEQVQRSGRCLHCQEIQQLHYVERVKRLDSVASRDLQVKIATWFDTYRPGWRKGRLSSKKFDSLSILWFRSWLYEAERLHEEREAARDAGQP